MITDIVGFNQTLYNQWVGWAECYDQFHVNLSKKSKCAAIYKIPCNPILLIFCGNLIINYYFIMPHTAKNHIQNRKKVCILCMKKTRKTMRTVSELVVCQLRAHVVGLENYNPDDPQLPEAICGTCRIYLAKTANGIKDSTCLPYLINYEAMIVSFNKNSTECICLICQIARKKVPQEKICLKRPVKDKRRPKLPRLNHVETIEIDCDDIDANISEPGPSIGTDQINEMRSVVGLSRRQTKKCAQFIRSNLGRKSIEPNVDFSLDSKKAILKDHFFFESMEMDVKENIEERIVVICHDIEDILSKVINHRNIDPYNHLVKIGIDGGQDFLKICMSVTNIDSEKQHSALAIFKEDGIKKILLLGIAVEVK